MEHTFLKIKDKAAKDKKVQTRQQMVESANLLRVKALLKE
jgi:hypothetical protein